MPKKVFGSDGGGDDRRAENGGAAGKIETELPSGKNKWYSYSLLISRRCNDSGYLE